MKNKSVIRFKIKMLEEEKQMAQAKGLMNAYKIREDQIDKLLWAINKTPKEIRDEILLIKDEMTAKSITAPNKYRAKKTVEILKWILSR